MYQELPIRSVLKAVSWRVVGTLATSVMVFVFLKRLDIAIAVGGMEALLKMTFYYAHERAWDRIQLGKRQIQPVVVWFTGLPSAGKTTLAQAVMERLEKRKIKAEHLDGDTIRNIFPNTGFSRDEREEHIKRVGFLASRLEKNGLFVVVSLISPWETSRKFVRNLCTNFVEVYVATPLEECERRDVKGLYKKARAGEVRQFTGVSDPYEAPHNAEITIDSSSISVDEATDRIISYLQGYL